MSSNKIENSDYTIVDGHLHVWNLQVRDAFPNKNFSHGWPDKDEDPEIYRNIPLEEAQGFTRYCGVKNVVFMQCYHDSPEEARWVYKTAQEHPFLKGIVAGLDITLHKKLRWCIEEFKKDFKRPKFVGVRNIDEPRETDHFLREEVHTGLAILEEYGVPFDLLIRPDHLQHVPLLATKFPKLKMVIDHIAKPLKYPRYPTIEDFENWKTGMANAAIHDNVYVKLSGIINETENWSANLYQPYIDHLLNVFSVKRLFFGSDWPVCRTATGIVDYPDVVKLLEDLLKERSAEDIKLIFQDNAIAFYGLEDVVDLK